MRNKQNGFAHNLDRKYDISTSAKNILELTLQNFSATLLFTLIFSPKHVHLVQ